MNRNDEYLKPLTGREFKHFKGKMYKYLGIVHQYNKVTPYTSSSEIELYDNAIHTETDEMLTIWTDVSSSTSDRFLFTINKNNDNEEDLVLYQAEYGENLCYLRPIDMFLSEVDRSKYPDVKQQYRFELVE